MKSFFIPLIIMVLFVTSCNEDFIATENPIEVEIQKRDKYPCIQTASCDIIYSFPTVDSDGYTCFSVTFDSTLTLDEIFCLKQAYFKCFPDLKMGIIQPNDPYKEMWCIPTGKQVNSISTTIDSDPRVDGD